MPTIVWIAFSCLVLLLFTGLFLYIWIRRPPRIEHLPPPSVVPARKLPTVLMTWLDEAPFIGKSSGKFIEQSQAWRERMRRAGHILASADVRQIYFLHGTFAGSDPFNILPPLKNLMPEFAAQWEKVLEAKMKNAIDKLARDLGNFLPDYIQLFAEATGAQIPCQLLHWSSANHHTARLQGAMRLIEDLNQKFPELSEGRILMIGHSHARQVFALFTQLISDSALSQELWRLIREEQLGTSDLERQAKRLAGGKFDFVTLGGPLRYPFAATESMRFLHIVNHRGQGEQAEQMLGALTTAGGDYVQQWGCAGSDTLATTKKERQLNRRLDLWLGKGIDSRVWAHSVGARRRVGEIGQTLLVDYRDQGSLRINGFATIFGHGNYTRFRVMLFNTEQICLRLYKQDYDKG